MKLYVSGPMSGIPEFNYPAFHAAKDALIAAGHAVISPADLGVRDGWDWIDYLLADIDGLFLVEGVAMLDGWQASKGARIERCIAQNRSLPVRPLADWLVPA